MRILKNVMSGVQVAEPPHPIKLLIKLLPPLFPLHISLQMKEYGHLSQEGDEPRFMMVSSPCLL